MICLLKIDYLNQWKKKDLLVESFSAEKSTSARELKKKYFDYAIVDMRLEDGSGLELIKLIKSK